MSWFERLTGFRESAYEEMQQKLDLVNGHLRCSRTNEDFAVVTLTLPSLAELRSEACRATEWQDKAGLVTGAIRMVDLLNESGAAVRGLALPAFMENALQQTDAIKAGKMFGPLDPNKQVPHTATRDSGAAAAQLLRDRSWTGQADMAVLGPEDLSYKELAAILSDVLGREVRYHQVSFDASKTQLLEHGASDAFAQGYVDMMRAKNEGMDNAIARASAIIGPTAFRQWAEAELRSATV